MLPATYHDCGHSRQLHSRQSGSDSGSHQVTKGTQPGQCHLSAGGRWRASGHRGGVWTASVPVRGRFFQVSCAAHVLICHPQIEAICESPRSALTWPQAQVLKRLPALSRRLAHRAAPLWLATFLYLGLLLHSCNRPLAQLCVSTAKHSHEHESLVHMGKPG